LIFATGCAVLAVMGLALARALAGPTIYDRVLAVNLFGSKTVLLICILDALEGNGSYLDIALVYALINYVGVIAMLRFYQPARPEERSREES
jgi:multicomponent Na+:H+ antiporter subunit F